MCGLLYCGNYDTFFAGLLNKEKVKKKSIHLE